MTLTIIWKTTIKDCLNHCRLQSDDRDDPYDRDDYIETRIKQTKISMILFQLKQTKESIEKGTHDFRRSVPVHERVEGYGKN